MATYAIGDLQGCLAEFEQLLEHCAFNPAGDRLWLVGDLVNRGPHSLGVLRRVAALGDRVHCVLGNHDLHLLACVLGRDRRPRPRDTLGEILQAPDCDSLIDWLRCRPLIHHDPALDYTMVHAGLPPDWDLATARRAAAEVEAVLAGNDSARLFDAMYGDGPARWSADLPAAERWRFTINALTRLRFCHRDGTLDLATKGDTAEAPPHLLPWYAFPGRASGQCRIVFGHWSTLRLSPAQQAQYRVYNLDTGCVWGGSLSALRLEDGARFSVPSRTRATFD